MSTLRSAFLPTALFLTFAQGSESVNDAWLDPARWQRALPFLAVTSLLAVGMFQLLALILASDARKVNVFLGTEETDGG